MKYTSRFFLLTLLTICIAACSSTESVKTQQDENPVPEAAVFEETVSTDTTLNIQQDDAAQQTEEDVSETEEISVTEDEVTEKEPQRKFILRTPEGNPPAFKETWGYVMRGREDEYSKSMPITDVCYFSAEIDCYGDLCDIPVRSNLKTGNARCHLVVACDSRAATHLAINPGFSTRNKILKAIVKAAAKYDGVQLDLEYVPKRDRKHYINFIADLRYMLKGKTLSVCVPARFKQGKEDVYPYSQIALYCDRVFVMAYDQHWSTSEPGPVSSPEWCKKVLAYAQKDIPSKKLIMGIPFYGRTWADEKTATAWYSETIYRKMAEHDVEEISYEDDIPNFKYNANVEVTGYFNDNWSLVALSRMYEKAGVQKVGFWRIGQEPEDYWQWINIKK